MKSYRIVFGLIALGSCQIATAQNLLSNVTVAESVTASAISTDYRYTRHTRSGSGRGARTVVYYTWAPFIDQKITQSQPLQLGVLTSVSAAGTFYGPTYSATINGVSSFTNSTKKAVLKANFAASTTVTTTLGAHQAVTVTAQPGGTINITLARYTNVTVTATGDASGVFQFGYGYLPLLALYGPGTAKYSYSLAPGNYWITTSLPLTAGINAQAGTTTNPGSTNAAYGFSVTFTPGSQDTAGDGGGG